MNINSRNEAWRQWVAVILWIGVIALESTHLFSSNNTGRFLYSAFAIFGPMDIFGPMNWARVSAILRIAGHLVGYGILSWLSFRAWRATFHLSRPARWVVRSVVLAVLLTAAVATLDEWHQSFLSDRTGKPSDVLLDTTAALAVQSFILTQSRLRRNGSRATDMKAT